jgi:hypothetical protein
MLVLFLLYLYCQLTILCSQTTRKTKERMCDKNDQMLYNTQDK